MCNIKLFVQTLRICNEGAHLEHQQLMNNIEKVKKTKTIVEHGSGSIK